MKKITFKSKFIEVVSLILIAVIMTARVGNYFYANRCHFIDCSPASWEQILDLAFAQEGNEYKVQSFSAEPSSWNRYTENGPTFVEIGISYISLNIDSARINEAANHPMKHLELDDQTLVFDTRTGNSWTSMIPQEDRQDKLRRVLLHPRDAFHATWALAEKESGLSAETANVLAILQFDARGYESLWAVTYHYDKLALTFYVDARTAQIIAVEKNVLSS